MTQAVLHSLKSEGYQNWTWNSMILPKKLMFSKHQNKMILAITLSNSSSYVNLMTSVASLAPSAMMTSTASMTSAASLTLRLPKMQLLCILSGFLGLSHLDSLFLWDWSLKIQFFYAIWHPLFQRLWRPAFGTSLKYKGQKSNAHYS